MDGMNLNQQRLVLQVIPPRSASNRDIAALETVMQGSALLATRHVSCGTGASCCPDPGPLPTGHHPAAQRGPAEGQARRGYHGGRVTAGGGIVPAVAFLARAGTA